MSEKLKASFFIKTWNFRSFTVRTWRKVLALANAESLSFFLRVRVRVSAFNTRARVRHLSVVNWIILCSLIQCRFVTFISLIDYSIQDFGWIKVHHHHHHHRRHHFLVIVRIVHSVFGFLFLLPLPPWSTMLTQRPNRNWLDSCFNVLKYALCVKLDLCECVCMYVWLLEKQ